MLDKIDNLKAQKDGLSQKLQRANNDTQMYQSKCEILKAEIVKQSRV